MGLDDDREASIFPPANHQFGQPTGPISSLNEACVLARCVTHSPINEVILPLMRNCFFGGAVHAVLLLQKGHGHQLASDIAGFIMEEPKS
jgi:hypothetical protein